MGEFMRRSVASQISDADLEAELQKRRPEFEALVRASWKTSNARAHAALDAALDEVEKTRRHFSRNVEPSVSLLERLFFGIKRVIELDFEGREARSRHRRAATRTCGTWSGG